jgi:hypothetical protein
VPDQQHGSATSQIRSAPIWRFIDENGGGPALHHLECCEKCLLRRNAASSPVFFGDRRIEHEYDSAAAKAVEREVGQIG